MQPAGSSGAARGPLRSVVRRSGRAHGHCLLTIRCRRDARGVQRSQPPVTDSAPVVDAAPVAEGNAPIVAFDADTKGNTLVPAQYPVCDRGAQILAYLESGNNNGDPELDRVFASYVGVPAPQARALAGQWIEACDKQQIAVEMAEAAAQAEVAASAAEARQEAAVTAERTRSCAAIGGETDHDGDLCRAPAATGEDCRFAWVYFTAEGTIDQESYANEMEYGGGCFPS